MSEDTRYPVPADWAAHAWVDGEAYERMYRRSIEDKDGFWAEQGQRIDWIKPYTQVRDVSYAADDLHIRWYQDGQLNVSANCLDRHLETRGEQAAIIWEGDDPAESLTITYRQLYGKGLSLRQWPEIAGRSAR